MNLKDLSAPFEAHDLDVKPIAVSKKTSKCLAVAYVTNRAIMDRLDAVCGPENWQNEFKAGPAGGLLCGISILINREGGFIDWVTKWDGAENTDIEAVKGGLSDSMKRAAVQWGMGRNLYHYEGVWVPIDEKGRIVNKDEAKRRILGSAKERADEVAGTIAQSGGSVNIDQRKHPTSGRGDRSSVQPAKESATSQRIEKAHQALDVWFDREMHDAIAAAILQRKSVVFGGLVGADLDRIAKMIVRWNGSEQGLVIQYVEDAIRHSTPINESTFDQFAADMYTAMPEDGFEQRPLADF